MDIEFINEEQSIQTLCFHYIQNNTPKSRTLLTNSILLQLASTPSQHNIYTIFTICNNIIKDTNTDNPNTNSNSNDSNVASMKRGQSVVEKQYYKNMGTLLRELTKKWTDAYSNVKEGEVEEMVRGACERALCVVSGQEFVAFVVILLTKVQLTTKILSILDGLFTNPKLHIGAYRQTTRQHFYTLLLKHLLSTPPQSHTPTTLSLTLHHLHEQKDPRNMPTVLRIYLHILTTTPTAILHQIKSKIFDALQMYYPIDFQGDAQQHNIKIDEIVELLDCCLTQPLFREDVRRLLMGKMAAVPIRGYIGTFLMGVRRGNTGDEEDVKFWRGLLCRLAQQQYLQQQYSQSNVLANNTLASLSSQLLKLLYPSSTPIPLQSLTTITTYLQTLLSHIYKSEKNSTHAHTIIKILKQIFTSCSSSVRELVHCYIVNKFIGCQIGKIEGDVVYVLGVLVPVLEAHAEWDQQKVGLFIITLSRLFHQSQQPHPKLLVLKLLLQLSKNQKHKKMLSKTNILQSCLQQVSSPISKDIKQHTPSTEQNQIRIKKAYVDYLVEVYSGDERVVQVINKCCMEVRVYGVLTLMARRDIGDGVRGLVDNKQHADNVWKHITNTLSILKPIPSISLIKQLSPLIPPVHYPKIQSIIYQKLHKLQQQYSQQPQQYMQLVLQNSCHNMTMMYFMKWIWKPYLINTEIRNIIGEFISKWISESMGGGEDRDDKRGVSARVLAWFNGSMAGMGGSMVIMNNSIMESKEYADQMYSMLPVHKQHSYTVQQCRQYPTLTHYTYLQNPTPQLLPHLPTSLLLPQLPTLLPHILSSQNTHILSSLVPHMTAPTLCSSIVPYVVQFLQGVSGDTDVQKIVDVNKILWELQKMGKVDEEVYVGLRKCKGRILVAIEERLLHFRKRRARQSARAVFSLYNTLK